MRCFTDLVILSKMKLKTLSPSEKWNVVFLKHTKMRNALGVGEVSGRMLYLILLRHGNTSLISSNHCYLPEICRCYCCADVFCWLNKFLLGFIIVYMFVFFSQSTALTDLTKYQSCVGCEQSWTTVPSSDWAVWVWLYICVNSAK